MSIAMDRIEPSGYIGGGGGVVACGGLYKAAVVLDKEEDWCCSSSTSSIGRNSDQSEGGEEDEEENEVQSSYKGPPLLVMDSLEEALPIRRGISKFYNGKSKSFASLVEASDASSVKEIAKEENAYSRRRRNHLAASHNWDKNKCSPVRNISKRPSSSRSSLALAVAISSSESISSTSEDSSSNSRSPRRLPPLHPQSIASAWRSYSVADLQHCTADATTNSYLS